MATAAKSKPVVMSKSRAVQPWEEELAKAAKRQAAVEKPMGLFKQVSVKAGIMYIEDKPIPGNAFNAVVLAATHENQWFNRAYDPNVPAVPACYAFGDQSQEDPEANMAPADDVEDKQGDAEGKCADCEHNKMGSADTGRGKACGNVRRLILVTEDAVKDATAMKEAEARSFKVPVMSVRNWVSFVHEVEETMKRPSYGVVVRVSCAPDKKSLWQIKFDFQEMVNFDSELWEAVQKRVKAAERDIVSPYPKLEEAPAPRGKAGGKAAPAGKAVAGKKVIPIKSAPAKKAGKY